MTLIEKLVVIGIIGLMAAFLYTALGSSYQNAKAWIWGSYALHENRLNAVLDGNDKVAELLLNQKAQKWTIIE